MRRCFTWFFGRGLSIECGLTWRVPAEWRADDRPAQIAAVKAAIRREMDAPGINTTSIRTFLTALAQRTHDSWHHRFITTNWDYLLQREVLRLPFSTLPPWLQKSHVS